MPTTTVGPEQVGGLELSVAPVANLRGIGAREAAQPDEPLGFDRAHGNGQGKLFGRLGVSLEENQNIGHGQASVEDLLRRMWFPGTRCESELGGRCFPLC